jgi:signal recognition particle subunit SRP54
LQGAIDMDKMSEMNRKMQKGDFDFNDYLVQTHTVRKMGGVSSMLKLIPGTVPY